MRICVGIPTVGVGISAESFYSHLNLVVDLGRVGDVVVVETIDVYPYAKARTNILEGALENDCDLLLFVDDDTVVPPGAFGKLLKVLSSDNSIVMTTALTYKRGYPYTPTWFKFGPDKKIHPVLAGPFAQPVDLDFCGLPFNLIDLKWIHEKLPKGPWFSIDDKQLPEDTLFCDIITTAGGRVVGVPSVRCGHVSRGIVVQDDNVEDLRRLWLNRGVR